MGGAAIMPPWPEILSKYNILLSQSHSLSMTLAAAHQASTVAQGNPWTEFIHHLRTQPTVDVLRAENDAVRHLATHMDTGGSLGVLGHAAGAGPRGRLGGHPEYSDVLREYEGIRDWKSRVEVDQEEPEDWEPGFDGDGAEMGEDAPCGGQSNDSDEEEELEEPLSYARAEVIEDVDHKHLGGFDAFTPTTTCVLFDALPRLHGLLKLIFDSNIGIPATEILHFDASGSIVTYPYLLLAHPKSVSIALALASGKPSTLARDPRTSSGSVPQANARQEPDGQVQAPSPSADGLYSWQEAFAPLVEGAFDHAEAAGTHAHLLRAIGFFLVGDCEVPLFKVALTRQSLCTTGYAVQFVARVTNASRRDLPRDSGATYELQHCDGGTAFERVLGTDTDVKCRGVSTSAYISNKQTYNSVWSDQSTSFIGPKPR
ncbi:uncharacterized protein BXZ73DRAFT_100967 [Epithele typhae]|uniref:uncharacterized protein n=1 Tax=Epithele typhae TaxID=378194 RepID=UPI0020075EFB|nr:uncharacterized protein BXZ73DRAFT_100967 [Epithele typhae]KAH9933583.1 hypothetical protein BXZ73DRAFT_100967 [Epithele typhae]